MSAFVKPNQELAYSINTNYYDNNDVSNVTTSNNTSLLTYAVLATRTAMARHRRAR